MSMRDVLAEQLDQSGIGSQLSGNKVEQRCLARPVGANDQPALSGRDVQIDIGRHVQTAERLAKSLDGEGAHGFASAPPATTVSLCLRLRHARRHRRTLPGTSPSGMRMTMATKIAPSR